MTDLKMTAKRVAELEWAKERPILFSAPMVRAILDGTKTQTRRVVKPQPHAGVRQSPFSNSGLEDGHGSELRCNYGQPGDRLWVRETWGVVSYEWNEEGEMVPWRPDRPCKQILEMRFGKGYYSGHVIYAADGQMEWAGDDDGDGERSCWHPSIHMPRWASRITLEIVSVRVERLNEISREDAAAEGICYPDSEPKPDWYRGSNWPEQNFAGLWESINGAGSWAANPWVWVVEFRRLP